MVIPPPNVTGQLHIGHALTVTIQDILVRWHKMQGDKVVWVPGVDHAGIATQTVVEKQLAKNEGLTRHDLGREEFLKRVWKWYEEYNGRIDKQLGRMGASLDWEKKVFTMDQARSEAVTRAFVKLYQSGLVYRDNRIINWCPALRTVISDLEVDHIELSKPTKLSVPGREKPVEFGVMHDFAYNVEGGGELVISTTRLETMLGDVAVAIHPDDERYTHLHGKYVRHPFFPDRRLPIVLDDILVDLNLGTGAVKITPAHDENDFACAKRHQLSGPTIFNQDGTLNANCGSEWQGMDRFEAREKLVKRLDDLGLYRGKRSNPMSLQKCSRSGDVIEPMLKKQWFVNCDEMAARALKLVETGEIELKPEWHKKTYKHFLENIRDWCVSRQLWWGHRIPAYKLSGRQEEEWIIAESEDEAIQQANEKYPNESPLRLEQDPDVLDTWFSSSIFPLTTMGWPQHLEKDGRYPLDVMETGTDILFFWVARMVMVCTELEPGIPFKKIFLHPIIRDRQGRKMSKSLGNVLDPIHVIQGVTLEQLTESVKQGNLDKKEVNLAIKNLKAEFPDGIPPCGADALRLALASYMHSGAAINMDINRVVTWRHFCNKLWQATRFALGADTSLPTSTYKRLETKWIRSRLDACIVKCQDGLRTMEFPKVTQALYDFVVNEFCDVYIEASKRNMKDPETVQTLLESLATVYKLMHPIAPFITEELWHRLDPQADTILMQPFPNPTNASDPVAEEQMQVVLDALGATRGARDKLVGVLTSDKLHQRVQIVGTGPEFEFLETQQELLTHLTRMKTVDYVCHISDPGPAIAFPIRQGLTARIPITIEQGDLSKIESEVTRLGNKISQLQKGIDTLSSRVESEQYKRRAPPHIQDKDRQVLQESSAEVATLTATRDSLAQLCSKAS